MNQSAFHAKVKSIRTVPLIALEINTLQVNVGYLCNLACKHCHVGAGPARSESMGKKTVDAVLSALGSSDITTLDITGGAPEMNPYFRHLVAGARKLGKKVIVRSNLTVLQEDGMQDLPAFFQNNEVELVASLPYYKEDLVDRVRGSGTFKKCISALQMLNRLGYGLPGGRILNLVYNPPGAFLAPEQMTLESEYKKEIKDRFEISFSRLYTFTNMPIGRFKDFLLKSGNLDKYMDKLACAFNPATLDNIMCRHLISVGWDGRLFDCDFNQVLNMPVRVGAAAHIEAFDQSMLSCREIHLADHCFGCTAGQGST